ncbi:hypothetical protein L6164_001730 [Bauhinia variegata]|uniref:Uncharacterized protein n=1 Tax=Bauhinia variegata TaxID=167791 RepID=A0ACB9QAA5_BAUVA|nr:hypothetical protein L6164_001730 [Bauhinia variegata]
MEEKPMGSEKKVMVVIDESEHTYSALMWLLENLKELLTKSSVTIFATQPFPNCGTAQIGLGHLYFPFATNQELINSILRQTQEISLALCEKAKSICARRGVKVEAFTEAGDPKEIICDAVHKHGTDLLVMANYPSNPFKRFFVETLSEYCMKNVKCPILLVEPKSVNNIE